MAKLDSLIVDLQLNTAELKKGLDEANDKLKNFGKKLDDLAGVITFEKIGRMAIDAGKALASFVLHGAATVDKMGKMAQSAGMSVESFSQWNYAASLADVSTEQLGVAMLKLNQNLAKAGAGNQEAVSLFRELGISINDSSGKARSADAVMGDLAQAFSHMKDGAAKAKLATEIFGETGARLIPLLNGGREGFAAAAAEADKFGVTVSTSAAKAAEQFNDNLTRLRTAVDVVGQRVAAQLAPAMTTLSNEFLNTKEGANTLKGAVDALAIILKSLVSAGVIVGAVFEAVGKTVARLASAITNVIAGNFEEAWNDLKGQFTDIGDAALSAAKRIEGIWSDSSEVVSEEAAKKEAAIRKSAEAIAAALEQAKKAAQEYKTAFAALTKIAEDYESKVSSFGFGELGLLEARLNAGDLADQLAKLGDKAEGMKQRILDAAQALNDLKIDLKMSEIKFTVSRAAAATDQDLIDRRNAFAIASSADVNARREMEMAGFKSFDDALERLATQTNRHAELLGEAELLRYQNDIEGAQAAMVAADEAARAAAEAGKAADAFTDLAKEAIEHQKQIISSVIGIISTVGEKGAEVGKLINSAMQGFQAGGLWGAIIAVIANLFAKLEAVGEFIDNAFGKFMEGFSQLNDSMVVLFQSLGESLEPVMRALSIAFKTINDVLIPIFSLLQQIREPFIELAEGFTSLIESTGILEFIVKAVAFVFNTVSLVIGTIILGLQYVWAGILRAVRAVVALFTLGAGTKELDETIAKHDQAIADTKARLEKTAQNLDDTNANRPEGSTASGPTSSGTAGGGSGAPLSEFELVWQRNERRQVEAEARRYRAYSEAIAAGLGYEAAIAAGELAKQEFLALPLEEIVLPVEGLGDAADDAANELNKFTASLTNVPTGFKYNLSKFNATMGEGGTVSDELAGAAREITINVAGTIVAEDDLINLINSLQRKKNFNITGNPYANTR